MTDGLSLVPVVVFYFFFFFLILSFVVFYFSSLFSQKGFFGMKYNKIKRNERKREKRAYMGGGVMQRKSSCLSHFPWGCCWSTRPRPRK
jgi:hypothetical protein